MSDHHQVAHSRCHTGQGLGKLQIDHRLPSHSLPCKSDTAAAQAPASCQCKFGMANARAQARRKRWYYDGSGLNNRQLKRPKTYPKQLPGFSKNDCKRCGESRTQHRSEGLYLRLASALLAAGTLNSSRGRLAWQERLKTESHLDACAQPANRLLRASVGSQFWRRATLRRCHRRRYGK